jgi:hypothetical protein
MQTASAVEGIAVVSYAENTDPQLVMLGVTSA